MGEDEHYPSCPLTDTAIYGTEGQDWKTQKTTQDSFCENLEIWLSTVFSIFSLLFLTFSLYHTLNTQNSH